MTQTVKTHDSADEARADLLADGSVTLTTLKAEYGIGRTMAYELMQAGKLPYTNCGRRRLIPRRAVVKLLAQSLVGVGEAG